MKNVFIDTNVFLNFYESKRVALRVFESLLDFAKKEKIKLILPEQVKDEFFRNRSATLAKYLRSINNLLENIKKVAPPGAASDFEEAKSFEAAQDVLAKACHSFQKKISERAFDGENPSNKLFSRIFDACHVVMTTDEIMKKAEQRFLKGNPPGKKDGSYGDEIIWETLLANADDDLVIISYDGDWCDDIEPNRLNGFLLQEWAEYKKTKIGFYNNLGEFINSIAKKEIIASKVIAEENQMKNSFQALVAENVAFHNFLADIKPQWPKWSSPYKTMGEFAMASNAYAQLHADMIGTIGHSAKALAEAFHKRAT